jgi:hypothetical protein
LYPELFVDEKTVQPGVVKIESVFEGEGTGIFIKYEKINIWFRALIADGVLTVAHKRVNRKLIFLRRNRLCCYYGKIKKNIKEKQAIQKKSQPRKIAFTSLQ